MKITKISSHQLRVELSSVELLAMDISFDDIRYESEETRTLMLSLLEAARLTTDFSPETKVFIEAYPTDQGGCNIYFSDLDQDQDPPKRWRIKKRAPSPVVYAFEDVDHLIAGSIRLFKRCSHRIHKSVLYQLDGNWRLVIYPLDVVENITLSLLDEFAPRCGEGEQAAVWLEEHADKILAENAVDLISSFFS